MVNVITRTVMETKKSEQFLNENGIEFSERNGELRVKCIFNSCDDDSRANEYHLYFSSETGQYQCKKCATEGNLFTLAEHIGVPKSQVFSEPLEVKPKVKLPGRYKNVSESDVNAWHAALSQQMSRYLIQQRGLSEEIIAEFKLGTGHDGSLVIPIKNKDGQWTHAKRRYSNKTPKYKIPAGAKASLFGAHLLSETDSVIICEGELDAILLNSRGFVAVSATTGAGTFQEEWVEQLQDKPSIFIVMDNDSAGEQGAIQIGKKLPHARLVKLPRTVGPGGDITDYFVKLEKTNDDFLALLNTGRLAEDVEELGDRFAKIDPPKTAVSVQQWRDVIQRNFSECLVGAEIGASVVASLLITDVHNPFGLVYVDVPSAGKTITLNFFAGIDELIYASDNFTPASLVSHASNRKKEELVDIDLLPRIRHKTLIVRDLAPMFAERQENLLKNLGVLTRVFDGEGYESDSGVHGKRGYRGDYTFMMLAGSTPIAPRVWKFMGSLGSRLFFLNTNAGDKTEEELADLLISKSFKIKEKECRKVTEDLVRTLWNQNEGGCEWQHAEDPEEMRKIISRCAIFLARLRGTISVWSEKASSDEDEAKHNHTNVVIEKPMRINQLLYNLARGHALLCGRNYISEEDMWVVIEVALSSAPYNRIKFVNALLEADREMSTSDVEEAINCSNPTALKEIETMRVLGVVEVDRPLGGSVGAPEKIIDLVDDLAWFKSEECKRLRDMKPGNL